MPVKHNNLACRAGFSAFPCVSFFSFLLWVSKALKGLNFLLSYSILWLASSRCLSPTPPPPSQGLLLQILCVKNLPGRPQLGYSNTWCHLDPPPFPLPLLPAHVQMNSLRLPASCLCVLYFFSFWLFIVSYSVRRSFHFSLPVAIRSEPFFLSYSTSSSLLPSSFSTTPNKKWGRPAESPPPPTLFKRGGPLSPLVAGRCHDSFVVSHIVSKSCWLDMTNTSHIYPAALWQTAV